MNQGASGPKTHQRERGWQSQEGWYLLAALLGIGGIAIAIGGFTPELGLAVLFLSSLCFGIGVLLHSVPGETA